MWISQFREHMLHEQRLAVLKSHSSPPVLHPIKSGMAALLLLQHSSWLFYEKVLTNDVVAGSMNVK